MGELIDAIRERLSYDSMFESFSLGFTIGIGIALIFARRVLSNVKQLAIFCFCCATVLFLNFYLTGKINISSLAPELIGVLIDVVLVVYFYDFLRSKEKAQEEEARERKKEQEKKEQEKKLLRDFLGNYLDDLIQTTANRFYFFFHPHEKIAWEFAKIPSDAIEYTLDNLDRLIQESDFYRVLRIEKAEHQHLYSERYIAKDGEKEIWVWSPEFDVKFRIPIQKKLEHFLQMFHSVIPYSLKEILLPLNNVLLEFNRLDIQLMWWGERPEKFMKEEQEQWLKQRLTIIGQNILKLMEYRNKILEEKKAG
ncbi:hypothetical protein [Planifilum fimeticola]